MKITASLEDYLETILILSNRLPVVRSIDIATELDFKKSSVSVAMKHLRENHYIEMNHSGYITLTEEGRKVADSVYERHNILCAWLESLGVPKETAANDACKMEHVVSPTSFDAIKKHVITVQASENEV